MRKSGWLGTALGAATFLATAAWAQDFGSGDAPDPDLEPSEVVEIQLEALRHNDDPATDAGIRTFYAFSSPTNRAQTGTLVSFATMIHSGFGEMLNHKEARLLPLAMRDGTALQPVELTGPTGETYRYVFVLTRQTEAPYQGCWMTDTVIGDAQAPAATRDDRSI